MGDGGNVVSKSRVNFYRCWGSAKIMSLHLCLTASRTRRGAGAAESSWQAMGQGPPPGEQGGFCGVGCTFKNRPHLDPRRAGVLVAPALDEQCPAQTPQGLRAVPPHARLLGRTLCSRRLQEAARAPAPKVARSFEGRYRLSPHDLNPLSASLSLSLSLSALLDLLSPTIRSRHSTNASCSQKE